MRQERILLRLVESMNFIHKNSRSRPILPRSFRVRHHLLDFLDSGKYRAELDELRASHVRDDLRQRSLSSARRSPENKRPDIVALNLCAQWLARRDQVLLPNEFIERSRTHPVCQWPRLVRLTAPGRNGLKQAHKMTSPLGSMMHERL